MTVTRTLTTAGLILAVAGMAFADPTVKLKSGGAKAGQKGEITIQAVCNGAVITAAVLTVQFDTAKMAINGLAAGDFVPGTDWAVNDKNVDGNKVTIILANANGQSVDGPIVTVKATGNATGFTGSTLTLDPTSNIADDQFNAYPIASQTAVFLAGPVKDLGGNSDNAISAAKEGAAVFFAAAAGTKLNLLDANTAAPVTGWETAKELGAEVTGRPAFGNMGGLAVAVGTSTGTGYVFKVADGTAIGAPVNLGGAVKTAPAFSNGRIYWAVQTASGPAMIIQHQDSTELTTVAFGAAADTITSSPAVFGGKLLVGSSAGVSTFVVDPITGDLSAATAALGGDFTTSPVVDPATGCALIADATGSVSKINIATNAPVGAAVALGTPVGSPFFSAGSAYFGGADGKVYAVVANALAVGPTAGPVATFSTAALNSPVVIGGSIYVADANGKFGKVGGSVVELGSGAGKAVAVTGPVVGTDSVITNTKDGMVVSLPLE